MARTYWGGVRCLLRHAIGRKRELESSQITTMSTRALVLAALVLLSAAATCVTGRPAAAAASPLPACSGLGKLNASTQACECRPGWTGPSCAELKNGTVPLHSGFRLPGYHVWGSQVIAAGGQYHMFASIYPGDKNFYSEWETHSEIVRAVAATPVGPFVLADKVLPHHTNSSAHPTQYWDRSADNPKMVQAADGTFLLFYTGSTWNGSADVLDNDLAQASQRVGLAHAASVEGPYTRLPAPVLSPRPGMWDSRITTKLVRKAHMRPNPH